MRFIKVLVLLIMFTFSLLFFIQNNETLSKALTIQFNLYPATADTPKGTEVSATDAGSAVSETAPAAPTSSIGGINLHWKSDKVPLYYVVLASFTVGMLFALCMLFLDWIRLRYALIRRRGEVKRLMREKNALEAQLAKFKKDAEAGVVNTNAKAVIKGSNESKELPEPSAKPATN